MFDYSRSHPSLLCIPDRAAGGPKRRLDVSAVRPVVSRQVFRQSGVGYSKPVLLCVGGSSLRSPSSAWAASWAAAGAPGIELCLSLACCGASAPFQSASSDGRQRQLRGAVLEERLTDNYADRDRTWPTTCRRYAGLRGTTDGPWGELPLSTQSVVLLGSFCP